MTSKLREQVHSHSIMNRRTFLGAGPMSTLVINAVIDQANTRKTPIALIPSRRQIDAASLGGGYVNRWSTESFSEYVRLRDKGHFVYLSRDHSGPWQGPTNSSQRLNSSHKNALEEALESLKTDIRCGFDLLHIDTSQGFSYGLSESQVEDDIIYLIEECSKFSKVGIEFEIGADEQSMLPESISKSEAQLLRITCQLARLNLPKPLFYVLQTGTKVMESRNIGAFDAAFPVVGMLPSSVQVPEIIRMCERNGVYLKEHNADYLSDSALDWHRRFGIHAANVAPEFGVRETTELIEIASTLSSSYFIDSFSNHVLSAGRWQKWMLKDSKASDLDKVRIAGHYHFADPEVIELRERLARDALRAGFVLEKRLSDVIEGALSKYLDRFGYPR